MINKCSKKLSVPIYVFDEHNEAFYFWHKAKHEGYITKPLDLFHVDAHSDMDRSDKFENSIFLSDKVKDSYLNIIKILQRMNSN